ncbi:unnamed protein product [Hydatigera taeniaeformis]|uniref:PDZ domain-containing protein n=1 Tax=Hydatigena taeniaeformis TaxID=6205 RepID=A0A0R3WI78_HYDTA|nr:unnamed protein product [Hydatigera taeniaeformis]
MNAVTQPGSPAEGQLHCGDEIHEINGQDTRTLSHLQATESIKSAGKDLKLTISNQVKVVPLHHLKPPYGGRKRSLNVYVQAGPTFLSALPSRDNRRDELPMLPPLYRLDQLRSGLMPQESGSFFTMGVRKGLETEPQMLRKASYTTTMGAKLWQGARNKRKCHYFITDCVPPTLSDLTLA